MPNEWWIVVGPFSDGDARPAHTKDYAEKRAKIIADRNPGTTVRVLAAIREFRTAETNVQGR